MSVERQVQAAMQHRSDHPEFLRDLREKSIRKKIKNAELLPSKMLTEDEIDFKVSDIVTGAQTLEDERLERAKYPWRQPKNVFETASIDEIGRIIDGVFPMRESVAKRYKAAIEEQADIVPPENRAYGIALRKEKVGDDETLKPVARVYVTSRKK